MTAWIVFSVVALIIFWSIITYNALIRAQINIDNSWSDISVFLKKRFDLIPGIVDTVKGYAAHEKQVLENVVKARTSAMRVNENDVQGMEKASRELGEAIRGLMLVVENYPDLKASHNFLELQKSLSQIEQDLSNARRYYNATVRENNIAVRQFPNVIVARLSRFGKRDFFELQDSAEAENVALKF